MFNSFFSTRFNPSKAVEFMHANPVTGVVRVLFNSGHSYQFNNVSRRAIVNLLANPNMSLGFWINANCVDAKRARIEHRYYFAN